MPRRTPRFCRLCGEPPRIGPMLRVAETIASFDSSGRIIAWLCPACWELLEQAMEAAAPIVRARKALPLVPAIG